MTSVTIREVTVGYGATPILTDLSLDIRSGEFMALLGASGSGKTTLLRMLAGFLRPMTGSVSFGDTPVCGDGAWVPPEQRKVGIVPQEGALFPHLSVAGNIGFGLPRGNDARIRELLELVGLPGMQDLRPQQLSGGQQQRVALARALAPSPRVLLLDEPFSALDAGLRISLRQEVGDLVGRLGITTLLVTHDQEEALSTAQRVAVIHAGRIEQVATPDELYDAPRTLAVARFVGEHVELPARWIGPASVDSCLGVIAVDAVAGATAGQEGVVLIRPESLRVSDEPSAGVAGQVVGRSVLGPDVALMVATEGQVITARVPRQDSIEVGQPVAVQVTGAGRFFAV